jgi:uncharacterized membrane protein YagU involved in acid resistance
MQFMKTGLLKTIGVCLLSTVGITLVGMATPLIGLPKMSQPELLSGMLQLHPILAWIVHFMIGSIFSFSYSVFFLGLIQKINNRFWRGIIFGLAVFIFAHTIIMLMGLLAPLPEMEGSMAGQLASSLIGHLAFGLLLGYTITRPASLKQLVYQT